MYRSFSLPLIIIAFSVLLLAPLALCSLPFDYGFRYPSSSSSSCDPSSGKCEFGSGLLVDSEVNRRILAAGITSYISYGSLTADRVPCSSAGRSYYGCVTSGPVNSYHRDCNKITRCSKLVR